MATECVNGCRYYKGLFGMLNEFAEWPVAWRSDAYNYAIPHAMPQAIPQTYSSFYPHRSEDSII